MASLQIPSPHPRVVDGAGAAAGIACAVHCALAGLAPVSLGTAGLGSHAAGLAEWLVLGVALVAALAAARGRYLCCRSLLCAWPFGGAALVLLLGRALESAEAGWGATGLVIAGGLGLSAAHIAKLRRAPIGPAATAPSCTPASAHGAPTDRGAAATSPASARAPRTAGPRRRSRR